ncbi:hypothetical protein KSX_51090 [Ktedonospora formicarum]|uniref:Oxygen sensor histidine kinase NreB n=2 Tax=Ktedonospora formicarum TaxID=2778364 RepID=A0A8J3MUI3_9CHLR|nr:hypothetical protein KSX_51090 [Ktedonospora formicarum]
MAGAVTFAMLPAQDWQSRTLALGGCLVFALWYGICVFVNPLWWMKHLLKTCGYLGISWMIWLGLVYLNVSFFDMLYILFLQIFLFLPLSWKIIVALILLVFSTFFVSLVYGMNNSIYFFLGIMFVVILTAFFVSSSIKQNYVQHNLIKELEETRQALARAERQAGVIEERQRLAYEIHDTLAQGFSSIVMHLEAAEAKWQGEATVVSEHIDRARRIARENASEARRLIWALQSEALGRASLGEVLSTLVARWSSENEISASAAVTGDIYPLRPEYEHILLRAAQEALTNVRKHAQASRITMTLSYMDQMVTLDIEDNGTGFEPGAREDLVDLAGAQSSGFGLKSLRERIEKLGGTLTIESAPGEGTILAAALPTPSQENQEQTL